jgi:hypothetical protein
MRYIVPIVVLMAGATLAAQSPLSSVEVPSTTRTTGGVPAATDDSEVLRSVIEHTIRPEVRRFSGNAKIPGDPPLLVLEQTSIVCESGHDPTRQVCVTQDELGLLRDHPELVQALLLRNRESAAVPVPENAGVLRVPFANVQQTLQQRSRETVGYSAFSLPGYSADGEHALVFGFYTCGGRCSQANLFVLTRIDGGWRVDGVSGLWMS